MERLRHRVWNGEQTAWRSTCKAQMAATPPMPAGGWLACAAVLLCPRSRVWMLVLLLAWPAASHQAPAGTCHEAELMLVHPVVPPAYEEVIDKLSAGLGEDAGKPVGVCAIEALSARSWSHPPRQVVAIGASAYSAAEQVFPRARVLPILVGILPPHALDGLSRFVDPALVLDQLRRVSPRTQTLFFIHLREIPAELVNRTQKSAEALGLHWVAIAVGGLREAALAIERVKAEATTHSAVWFHRDVLALNPDILVPPIVRHSWKVGLPVISDDSDTIERGLLFTLTPDYRAVGQAAAAQLARKPVGLIDLRWVHRVLNARTARAIGLAMRAEQETGFDAVYD